MIRGPRSKTTALTRPQHPPAMLLHLLTGALVQAGGNHATTLTSQDLRTHYDVQSYELVLSFDPGRRELAGHVLIEALVASAGLEQFEFDLNASAELEGVSRLSSSAMDGAGLPLRFTRERDRVRCKLEGARGERLLLLVQYRLRFEKSQRRGGLHWATTAAGEPWIASFSQPVGAHSWWPCKSAYYHPEDKAERVSLTLTVPDGLVAVANGRQLGAGGSLAQRPTYADAPDSEEVWRTFRWHHEYPLTTDAVAVAIGPFVESSRAVEIADSNARLPIQTWVLPAAQEAAAVQFAEVEELLTVYTRCFGPYPFPRSKVGIVQVPYLGMGHASLLCYGSSFPAWCKKTGATDPYKPHNRDYDRTLVHELAHEWWGNAVSAADWGDLWLHESFAAYAEGVWLEAKFGREAADRHFERLARAMRKDARLILGTELTPPESYAGSLYDKGPVVLHTLRHCIGDDELWWQALRTFQQEFRYGSARSGDFQAIVERKTARSWQDFFDEWVRGLGTPSLTGSLCAIDTGIEVAIHCGSDSGQAFHVPLDLRWTCAGAIYEQRLELQPGMNAFTLPSSGPVEGLELLHLVRLPGRHKLRTE